MPNEGDQNYCTTRRVVSFSLSIVILIVFAIVRQHRSSSSSSRTFSIDYPESKYTSFHVDDFSLYNPNCHKAKPLSNSLQKVNVSKKCLSLECKQVAEEIKAKLNLRINPCDDFYHFACGNWLAERKRALITKKSAYRDNFEVLSERLMSRFNGILEEPISFNEPKPLQYAKRFYKSCLNLKPGSAATLNEFKSVLDQLLANIHENTTFPDLFKALAELRRDLGHVSENRIMGNYVFSIAVQFDAMHLIHGIKGSAETLMVKPGDFTLDVKDDHIYNSLSYDSFKLNYISYIKETWDEIYPHEIPESFSIASKISDIEGKLAKLRTQVNAKRMMDGSFYRNVSIAELNSITKPMQIWWEDVLTVLMNGTDVNLNIPGLKLKLLDPNFFQSVGQVLLRFSMNQIKNYLKWRIILDFGPQMGIKLGSMLDTSEHLELNIERHCAEVTEEHFGMAVLYRYIQLYFNDRLTDSLKQLVGNLKEAFSDLIVQSSCTWLDQRHVEGAKRKLKKMKLYAAYPIWLKNVTALNEFYKGLVIREGYSGIQNQMILVRYKSIQYLKRFGKQKDLEGSRWPIQPTDINAANDLRYNSIAIPAAILETPLYGMPMQYLNYGALGSIIGHEILHGFDPTGVLFDEDGTVDIRWSARTQHSYLTRSKCFVTQFNGYRDEKTGIRVNGTATLDENVADSGGIRTAFEAYQNYVDRAGAEDRLPNLNYTSNQMFFLSYAQTWCRLEDESKVGDSFTTDAHTVNRFRVQGSLHNYDEFHKSWGCRVPAKHSTCRIW